MADITMCNGTDCPFKEDCYRYTANKGAYQYYFVNVPYNKESEDCHEFWADERHKILKRNINGTT